MAKPLADMLVNIHKPNKIGLITMSTPAKKVMKAINCNDAILSNKKGNMFQINKKTADLKRVHAVVIAWRHPPNCQNGQ